MSSTIVDTDLLADLQKFGAADVTACFSCGNCTARFMNSAQIGAAARAPSILTSV